VVKGGVPAGLHALRVHKEGFKTLRTTVEVVAGESTVVSDRLIPLVVPELLRRTRRALAGSGEERPEIIARDMAKIAEVPAVLLSQVTRGSGEKRVLVVAVVLATAEQPYRYGARLEAGREAEVGKTLAWQISDALDGSLPPPDPPADLGLTFDKKLLGETAPEKPKVVTAVTPPVAPVVVPLPPPIPPPEPEDDYTPVWGRWWFWAGAGAVVAAAVGTTLALTLGGGTQTIHEPDRIHVLVERVVR
jgi:hypothetical protein